MSDIDDGVKAAADEAIGSLNGLSPEQIDQAYERALISVVGVARPNRPGAEAHLYTPTPIVREIHRRWGEEIVRRWDKDDDLETTPQEQELAGRVHASLTDEELEFDVFLSYSHEDGKTVAAELEDELTKLGVRVWRDERQMQAGRSMAQQIAAGLGRARAGVAVLTPTYISGRFWTDQELGALLGKDKVIPVLHKVTFAEVGKYNALLAARMGYSTDDASIAKIAVKIAAAVST